MEMPKAGAGGAEEEGAKASDGPRALALRVPEKVIVGSSGFQQFFLMYAKLMAGLRDSKVNEYGTTPQAMHKAVISAGNPSLEELD